MTSVWDGLVGQRPAIAALQTAAAGQGMSHAWLFTGPPGSGRSNAAIAFAAALQCEDAGCGACHACHTVLAGTHADVTLVRTQKLSIGVDEVRDLVRRSALAPVGRRWQILIVEDADRLTEQACNALLKAIEEPTDRTVWMLCAPTVEDVLPTIRSRCRLVTLSTPPTDEVAGFLVRSDGVDAGLASYAARASQGHIGRARALARDEGTRNRRREVVEIPARLTSLGACMNAAQNLGDVTKEEADLITGELDAREKSDLDASYGVVERGRRPREYAPALRRARAQPEDPGQAPPPRRRRPEPDGPRLGLPRRDRDLRGRARTARQRGDPARRREGRPRLDPRAQPAPDRLDLRRPRADARVQRAGAARAGVDDAGAQGARRGGSVRRVVAIIALLCMVVAGSGVAVAVWLSGDGSGGTSGQPDGPAALAPTPAEPEPGSTKPPSRALKRFYGQGIVWSHCDGSESLECATVTVPLDYGDPRGSTIDLALVKDPAADPDHRQGTLLVNPGGPGAPATTMAAQAPLYLGDPVLDRYDVVGVDPRGVGDSSPVDCLTDEDLDAYIATDPAPDTAEEKATLLDWVDDFGGGCAEKSGALAAHVSTVEAARDMDVVRAALGESQLDYYGASYGTKLGATYAELFPAEVGRFVLDGGLDPTIDKRSDEPPAGSRVRDGPACVRRELHRELGLLLPRRLRRRRAGEHPRLPRPGRRRPAARR